MFDSDELNVPHNTELQIDADADLTIRIPSREFDIRSQPTLLAVLAWNFFSLSAAVIVGGYTLKTGDSIGDFAGAMCVLSPFVAFGIYFAIKAAVDISEEQTLELTPDYLTLYRRRMGRESIQMYSRHDINGVNISEQAKVDGTPVSAVCFEPLEDDMALATGRCRVDLEFIAQCVERWMDGDLFDERGRLIAEFA